MKINTLNDSVFCDFASAVIGDDVLLYNHDLEITRCEKGVKVKVFLGGEMDDYRKVLFQDGRCMYANAASNDGVQDLSYEWVRYLLENVDQLTEEDKQVIVDVYNKNIEKDIEKYAQAKRQYLINKNELTY